MAKVRVLRLLEYIGEEEAVIKQLGNSLPTGKTRLGRRARDGSGPLTISVREEHKGKLGQNEVEKLWRERLDSAQGRVMGESEGMWKGRMNRERRGSG